MFVTKRGHGGQSDTRIENVQFDKITLRIRRLCDQEPKLHSLVDPVLIAQKVIRGIFSGITTVQLDTLAAENAACLTSVHPDYSQLAARIQVSNLHKETIGIFSKVMEAEYSFNTNVKTEEQAPLISDETIEIVRKYSDILDNAIDYSRDFGYDTFGLQTLFNAYLVKVNGVIAERPQDMHMRIAVGIHGDDIDSILKTYDLLSKKFFIHATPTMYAAGTPKPQMSSCFLLKLKEDSIDGIYSTLKDCALISKSAGGIGVSIHNVRASGSYIKGTNGISNGIVPMLRVFNDTARYVDQCFEPATIVYTKTGPKPIFKIKIGDEVLSHNGVFRRVQKRVAHHVSQQEMICVGVEHSNRIVKTTPNHQIMSLKHKKNGNVQNASGSTKDFCKLIDAGLMVPEMIDVNDLEVGDFVLFPIPNGSDMATRQPSDMLASNEAPDGDSGEKCDVDDFINNENVSTEIDFAELSLDDFRMYGLLLGTSGHFYEYDSQGRCNCQLTLPALQDTTVAFIKKFLSFRNITFSVDVDKSSSADAPYEIIKWDAHSIAFNFDKSQFYANDGHKHLKQFDSSFLNLPKSKLNAIICGLFESSSYEIKLPSHIPNVDGTVDDPWVQHLHSFLRITTPSLQFGDSLRWILMRCGILVSGGGADIIANPEFQKSVRGERPPLSPYIEIHMPSIGRIMESTRLHASGDNGSEVITYPFQHYDVHSVDSKLSDNNSSQFTHNGVMYSRVKSLSTERFDGVVYDLEVEVDHTYTTQIGVVHNGGGKRKGSFAIYLEPWHADIFDFLNLKKSHGKEELRARDLFYGLWIPNLFMERVESGGMWTLFCPAECPGLSDCVGDDFKKLYEKYEADPKKVRKQVKAIDLWWAIIDSQIETGTPYMLYKDAANEKNNQKNLGIIRSSNLCTEIMEYTSADEIAVCNLASIGLSKFVNIVDRTYNHEELFKVVYWVTGNLNNIIDRNYYPVPEARNSNLRHRPIGVGVQGLADAFILMRLPFESKEAYQLNTEIFETIYFAALTRSKDLAKIHGPYQSFQGSPASAGNLQFDLWGVDPAKVSRNKWDWQGLKDEIKKYGLRNSLVTTVMPTASTSQILQNNECFVGDTPITMADGTNIPIRDVRPGMVVSTYSSDLGGVTSAMVTDFLPRGEKDVIRLTLEDGRTITCTADHRLLLGNGEWCEASKTMGENLLLGLTGTPDVVSNDELDYELRTKAGILHMNTDRELLLSFARIVGFIRSDGCVLSGKVTAVFGQALDRDQFITESKMLWAENSKISWQTNSLGCFEVLITGKLASAIRSLEGITVGARVSQPCSWPAFILDAACPAAVLREFLAGFFGGDGCCPCLITTHDQTKTFSPITLVQSSCAVQVKALEAGMEQLCKLLERAGIPGAYISNKRSYTNRDASAFRCGELVHYTVRIALPLEAFSQHIFMDKIGIRFSVHKAHRFEIVASWARYLLEVKRQHEFVCRLAENYQGTLTKGLAAAIEALAENEAILNEHYSTPKISQLYGRKHREIQEIKQFKFKFVVAAEEFVEKAGARAWFSHGESADPALETTSDCQYAVARGASATPVIKLKVIGIHPAGRADVYDINVQDHHNFLANGIIAHNCIEPYTTNIYLRRVLAGEFVTLNKHLYNDLLSLGLWNDTVKNKLLAANGSVQDIPEIPKQLKELYKTVWEISMKCLIDMSAGRAPFVDQSQSLNMFVAKPDRAKLTKMHFYAWQKGLKTGMYYLRTRPAADALKFTVNQQRLLDGAGLRESQPVEESAIIAASSSIPDETAEAEVCSREHGCQTC